MAPPKPPLDYSVLKHFQELDREMKEMENAIVALHQVPKDSEDYKRAFEKLRKDQKEMAKKLEALRKFDIKAKEQISDIMLNAIRLLGTLNLNPDLNLNSDDDVEQESSDASAASTVNKAPPSMTYIRRWTMERLGLTMAEAEGEAAREDLQIEVADDDNLHGDDSTTSGGKTEKAESSVPERTEDVAKGG